MKNIRHTFLKNCKGYKIETWYTHCVYQNQDQEPVTLGVACKSLDRFYSLP